MLQAQSLDAFLVLRLIRVAIISCFVGCLITWPILLPLNAVGPGLGSGFNMFLFGHAASSSDKSTYYRYYVHAFCAYAVFGMYYYVEMRLASANTTTGFIMYMINREARFCYQVRQAYVSSPSQADLVSSRTVLYLSVPKEYQDEKVLRKLLGENNVRCVWIPKETKKLEAIIEERNDIAMKLEKAEINLVKDAHAEFLKPLKQHDTEAKGVSARKRPSHRLRPLIGEKVDTIEWAKEGLNRLSPQVKELQKSYNQDPSNPNLGCVFVEFNGLREAQAALQSVTHHEPGRMTPRYISVHPDDLIWSNLGIRRQSRSLRYLLYVISMVALVVLWSIPVVFIGTFSKLTYLQTLPGLHWLSFVNKLPAGLSGIVPGLVPTLLLTILMSILPLLLRCKFFSISFAIALTNTSIKVAARLSSEISHSEVEYTVQNVYFAFQVIQVFLVTTLSSGLTSAIQSILNNPQSTINLLATSLPQASTFYLCYFIVQGLGVVSGSLTNIFSFLLFFGLGSFDKTPRSRFNRWTSLDNPNLGTLYPIYTNLFVIGKHPLFLFSQPLIFCAAISYACIAPLVLGFAVIGLTFFWVAIKYEFLYVYDVPHDTKGRMYVRALQQVFVGLYLAELCMIGLFSLSLGDSSSKGRTLGPLILLVILLVITALYHLYLNRRLHPLMKFIPASVMQERMAPTDVDNTAYLQPCLTDPPPLLWIPKDKAGASKEEISGCAGIIGMTDEGAYLDDKNKIRWDSDDALSAPIYVEKPEY